MCDFGIPLNNDFFGCIALVKTGNENQIFEYKVVGETRSSYYCDVPLKLNVQPQMHEHEEDVLLLIHCGFLNNTTTVYRVAKKDCHKIENETIKRLITKISQNNDDISKKTIEILLKEGEYYDNR